LLTLYEPGPTIEKPFDLLVVHANTLTVTSAKSALNTEVPILREVVKVSGHSGSVLCV
jgi:hypothetical protein